MSSTTTSAPALGVVVDAQREAVLTGQHPHAERWHVVPVGQEQHAVVDQASGLVLQVDSASGAVGVQEWSGGPPQRWQLRDAGDGRVAVAPSGGAGVITLGRGGGPVVVAAYEGDDVQLFALGATAAQRLDLSGDVEEALTRSGTRRMRTRASLLTVERRLVAVTTTWRTMRVGSFHGSVVVLFEDALGRVAGATAVHRVGVLGSWSAGYDSAVQWEHEVPAETRVDRITGVRPLHSCGTPWRFEEAVEQAVAGSEPVADLVERVRAAAPAD